MAEDIDGIIDAHVHLWTPDQARFPRDLHYSGPDYEPASFTPEQLLAIARPCGVKRAVLVQMSFYGTDNSYMLDAIKRYPGLFSGVGVVDYGAASLDGEMTRLAALGVRGFRVDRGNRSADWLETANMQRFWSLAAEKHLVICPLLNPGDLPALDRMCSKYPRTTVVIDHMARIGANGDIREEDVKSLCRLGRHNGTHVKISAFYALGKKEYPYTDLIPMIHALYDDYGPQRIMWASDSPFQVAPTHSYGGSLELLRDQVDFLRPGDSEWLLRKSAETVFFLEENQFPSAGVWN